MTMVVRDKQRIFYRFEGEKGAFLLLHHGLFGSHLDWYDAGYVKKLGEEFRLILPDARGHGRSSLPGNPTAYQLGQFADDIIAIMDELGIHNLHFFGYSLGALVGLELLLRHPERVRIVMMAGETPFITPEMSEGWKSLAGRIRQDGTSRVIAELHEERIIPYLDRLPEAEGHKEAALALLEALASTESRPDNGRLSVDSPVALFTGEKDPARERIEQARKRIHRARFVCIPDLDHAGLFQERESLVAEMMRLLRSGKKEGGSSSESRRDTSDRKGRAGGKPAPHTPSGSGDPLPEPPPFEPEENTVSDPPEAHHTNGDEEDWRGNMEESAPDPAELGADTGGKTASADPPPLTFEHSPEDAKGDQQEQTPTEADSREDHLPGSEQQPVVGEIAPPGETRPDSDAQDSNATDGNGAAKKETPET